MTTTLAALPKGHRFPPVAFDLSSQWVSSYVAAVEDAAIGALADAVPPMAVAALSIRALLQSADLPPGAVHLGQDLTFRRAVRVGETLSVAAEIVSRGERQGWVLMGVGLSAAAASGEPVMTGRATLTFPLAPDAGT